MKWRFGMVGFPETLSVEMLEINSDSDGTVFLVPKDHESAPHDRCSQGYRYYDTSLNFKVQYGLNSVFLMVRNRDR